MMSLFKILISILIGVCFSFILIFFFGNAGIKEYISLKEHKTLLEENITDLEQVNTALNVEFISLKQESERIRLLSRDLGYFLSNEHVITIDGYPVKKEYYQVGKIIRIIPGKTEYNLYLRIFGLILPIIVFIFFIVLNRTKKSAAK